MTAPFRSNWRLIALLIFAGVIAAFQIGKAAITLPLFRHDLAMSLVAASWVVGACGVLGALVGLPAGIGISMMGARNALVSGLFVIAAGSLAGAVVPDGMLLLYTRLFEGIGFLAVVIATPTLLRGVAAPKDSDVIFASWGAYIPAGTLIMMATAPLLPAIGWRGLWVANALVAVLYAAVIWMTIPPRAAEATRSIGAAAQTMKIALRAPGPLLVALGFTLYTIQYYALTGLMPTLLVERMGFTLAQAGGVTALTILANGIGNVSAGALARCGIPLWLIMAAAFSFSAIASFGIFLDNMPVVVVAVLASASLAITGVVPATIFAVTPRLAGTAALLAVTMGLMVQASNMGQFIGPGILGAWVERFSWSTAPVVFVAIGLGGVIVALCLRRILRAS